MKPFVSVKVGDIVRIKGSDGYGTVAETFDDGQIRIRKDPYSPDIMTHEMNVEVITDIFRNKEEDDSQGS